MSKLVKFFLYFVGLFGVLPAIVMSLIFDRQPSITTDTQSASISAQKRENKEPTIGQLITIKKMSWQLGKVNSILVVDLQIENKNAITLKDFVIECEALGNSGTPLGKVSKTIYDILPANKIKSINSINMGFINGQAARVGCAVIGALPENYK